MRMPRRPTLQGARSHRTHQALGLHVRHQAHQQAAHQRSHAHSHRPPGGILQRDQRKDHHTDAPQHGAGHRLQRRNAQHQIPHHVGVIGFRRALPSQHRREENECGGDARDDREQEVAQIQSCRDGVRVGQRLRFVERNQKAQERGHAQRTDHVGGQNRRCVQGPSGLAGPCEVAEELSHAYQPN